MKNLLTLSFVLLLITNIFGADPLHIINTTTNYTLLFTTVAKTPACYLEIRDHNTDIASNGYCDVSAGNSISFSTYATLSTFFPNLSFSSKNSSSATPAPLSLGLADTYLSLSSLNMNWAYINYKVTHNTTGSTEGVMLGFSDFFACDGILDYWGTYGVTETESFTTFTIGSDRYFIVGEY